MLRYPRVPPVIPHHQTSTASSSNNLFSSHNSSPTNGNSQPKQAQPGPIQATSSQGSPPNPAQPELDQTTFGQGSPSNPVQPRPMQDAISQGSPSNPAQPGRPQPAFGQDPPFKPMQPGPVQSSGAPGTITADLTVEENGKEEANLHVKRWRVAGPESKPSATLGGSERPRRIRGDRYTNKSQSSNMARSLPASAPLVTTTGSPRKEEDNPKVKQGSGKNETHGETEDEVKGGEEIEIQNEGREKQVKENIEIKDNTRTIASTTETISVEAHQSDNTSKRRKILERRVQLPFASVSNNTVQMIKPTIAHTASEKNTVQSTVGPGRYLQTPPGHPKNTAVDVPTVEMITLVQLPRPGGNGQKHPPVNKAQAHAASMQMGQPAGAVSQQVGPSRSSNHLLQTSSPQTHSHREQRLAESQQPVGPEGKQLTAGGPYQDQRLQLLPPGQSSIGQFPDVLGTGQTTPNQHQAAGSPLARPSPQLAESAQNQLPSQVHTGLPPGQPFQTDLNTFGQQPPPDSSQYAVAGGELVPPGSGPRQRQAPAPVSPGHHQLFPPQPGQEQPRWPAPAQNTGQLAQGAAALAQAVSVSVAGQAPPFQAQSVPGSYEQPSAPGMSAFPQVQSVPCNPDGLPPILESAGQSSSCQSQPYQGGIQSQQNVGGVFIHHYPSNLPQTYPATIPRARQQSPVEVHHFGPLDQHPGLSNIQQPPFAPVAGQSLGRSSGQPQSPGPGRGQPLESAGGLPNLPGQVASQPGQVSAPSNVQPQSPGPAASQPFGSSSGQPQPPGSAAGQPYGPYTAQPLLPGPATGQSFGPSNVQPQPRAPMVESPLVPSNVQLQLSGPIAGQPLDLSNGQPLSLRATAGQLLGLPNVQTLPHQVLKSVNGQPPSPESSDRSDLFQRQRVGNVPPEFPHTDTVHGLPEQLLSSARSGTNPVALRGNAGGGENTTVPIVPSVTDQLTVRLTQEQVGTAGKHLDSEDRTSGYQGSRSAGHPVSVQPSPSSARGQHNAPFSTKWHGNSEVAVDPKVEVVESSEPPPKLTLHHPTNSWVGLFHAGAVQVRRGEGLQQTTDVQPAPQQIQTQDVAAAHVVYGGSLLTVVPAASQNYVSSPPPFAPTKPGFTPVARERHRKPKPSPYSISDPSALHHDMPSEVQRQGASIMQPKKIILPTNSDSFVVDEDIISPIPGAGEVKKSSVSSNTIQKPGDGMSMRYADGLNNVSSAVSTGDSAGRRNSLLPRNSSSRSGMSKRPKIPNEQPSRSRSDREERVGDGESGTLPSSILLRPAEDLSAKLTNTLAVVRRLDGILGPPAFSQTVYHVDDLDHSPFLTNTDPPTHTQYNSKLRPATGKLGLDMNLQIGSGFNQSLDVKRLRGPGKVLPVRSVAEQSGPRALEDAYDYDFGQLPEFMKATYRKRRAEGAPASIFAETPGSPTLASPELSISRLPPQRGARPARYRRPASTVTRRAVSDASLENVVQSAKEKLYDVLTGQQNAPDAYRAGVLDRSVSDQQRTENEIDLRLGPNSLTFSDHDSDWF